MWAGIEGAARQLAAQEGEIYVVSGPAFIGSGIQQVGNVLVPTHLWKVLYSPKQQRAGAYVVTNDETREYSVVSVSDLETMVGVKLLPGLPRQVRDGGMDLPKPSAQRGKKPRSQQPEEPKEEFTLRDFSRGIIDAIGRAGKHQGSQP
nr:DNA/RNA non-specific endonuclease [Polaromonas naphthalenivorans]